MGRHLKASLCLKQIGFELEQATMCPSSPTPNLFDVVIDDGRLGRYLQIAKTIIKRGTQQADLLFRMTRGDDGAIGRG